MSRRPGPINHGTYSGYQAEMRRGLPSCPECQRAASEYMRQYRLDRGETTSVLVPVALLSRIAATAEPSLATQIRSLLPKAASR